MAAFLIQRRGNKSRQNYHTKDYDIIDDETGGIINFDNATEEILNGMFCHYEPPTSESAQLKAAYEVRTNPMKYAYRPAPTKPILRPSTLHPKHSKKNKRHPKGSKNKKNDGNNGGKSVTWRDEQNKQDKVESKIVGCASTYCGVFKHGQGLADILSSTPNDTDKICSGGGTTTNFRDTLCNPAGATTKESKTTPPTPIKTVPTSTTSAATIDSASPASTGILRAKDKYSKTNLSINTPQSAASSSMVSVDETFDSASERKLLTPILTDDNNKESTGKVLYDDLGNPIRGDEDDDDGDNVDIYAVNDNENIPPTPDTPATMNTPRTLGDENIDTPTAEKTAATNPDFKNPFAFLCNVPMAVLGSAAAAVGATGYVTTINPKPDESSSSSPPQPFPPAADTGVSGEYRQDIGVYEPEDYDKPFPDSIETSNAMAYKRIRSPPVRRRQPTPRRPRVIPSHEEEHIQETEYYKNEIDDDGVVVQSLAKIPRQSNEHSNFDATDAARYYTPRRNDTITGATSNSYKNQEKVLSHHGQARPSTRRSDIYSDLTMEEDYYYYHDELLSNPQHDGKTIDYEEEEYIHLHGEMHRHQPYGRSGFERRQEERLMEEQARFYYVQDGARRPSRRKPRVQPKVILGADDEEQLSPREYAERYRQRRSEAGAFMYEKSDDKHNNRSHVSQDINPLAQEDDEKNKGEQENENGSEESKPGSSKASQQPKNIKKKNSRESLESKDSSNKQRSGARQSQSSRTGKAGSHATSSHDEHGDDAVKRDPTPRNSMDPVEAGKYRKKDEPLPPTPRKDQPENESEEAYFGSNYFRSAGNFDFGQKSIMERAEEARQAMIRQFSPRSLATDDEIREEVSSVGMASETIRPLYKNPNPFKQVPPPVIEERPKKEKDTAIEGEAFSKSRVIEENSASTSGGSTLSSKETLESSRERFNKKNEHRTNRRKDSNLKGCEPSINHSSSGSTRSKKLWKGWKKTIGKVKKIVKDIDEQRIHPPHLSHTIKVNE